METPRLRANSADVRRALTHENRAAGVEQIERVRGLQYEFIGRKCELRVNHVLSDVFVARKEAKQQFDVRVPG